MNAQQTRGKKNIPEINDLPAHTIAIDSVFYHDVFVDTVFYEQFVFDTTFVDSNYTIHDTTLYDVKNVLQNEAMLTFEQKFSPFFSGGLKMKYSVLRNSNVKSALMFGNFYKYRRTRGTISRKTFLSETDFLITCLQYSEMQQRDKIIESTEHYTTYDDTIYAYEPDSVRTTYQTTITSFDFQEFSRYKLLYQFSQNFSLIFGHFLLGTNLNFFGTADSKKINFFYAANAAYYLKYFGIFGGFSDGEKYLLQNAGGKFLEAVEDRFVHSFHGGLIVYPLFRKWSISYEFAYGKYEKYNVQSHNLNIFYQF